MLRHYRKIRWGIIGCGAFGERAVAPSIIRARGGYLVSVQRKRLKLARKTAERLKLSHYCDDERQMLAGDLVDAVFVASPNSLHAPQTARAAGYGKSVLVEKPMALDAKEALGMVRACRKAGVKLMVGQSSRFYPQAMKARELVKRGALGKVRAAQLFFAFIGKGAGRKWILDRRLAGGGPVMDIGVHLLDTLCYVLDDEVAAVAAWMSPARTARRVEEECMMHLRMKKGALAQLYCSYHSPGGHQYRLLGERGSLAMQLRDGAPLALDVDYRLKSVKMPAYDHIRREVELFNKHLLGQGPNPVPGETGVQNMRVIDAAYKAAKTGREVKL